MNLKQIGWAAGVLGVLAIIFGAWASYTKPVAHSAVPPQDSLGGTLTANGDYKYTEDKPYYSITATYPAKTGLAAAADAKARAIIEKGIADQIAQFKADNQLNTMTAADAQTQGLSGDRKYALDMEYKAYTGSSSVSYAYAVYADTLGAHPNGYYKTFVFDNAGTQATLKDFFAPGADYLAPISKEVTTQVTQQLKVAAGSTDVSGTLYSEGLAATDNNFQNFVVDGDTLDRKSVV